MYFVDRNQIEEKLVFMEKQLQLLAEHQKWETQIEKAALERLVHLVIESVLDIGNAMIDGFIMRDPGSYEDIVDILLDEKVIQDEQAAVFKKVIAFRKMLVQQYTEINHDEISGVLTGQMTILEQFGPAIRTYLLNELGPVSAFKN